MGEEEKTCERSVNGNKQTWERKECIMANGHDTGAEAEPEPGGVGAAQLWYSGEQKSRY
jgi:hypothetical protein